MPKKNNNGKRNGKNNPKHTKDEQSEKKAPSATAALKPADEAPAGVAEDLVRQIRAAALTANPAPVMTTIEHLPREIQAVVDEQGLEAAVAQFGVEKILSWQLCVMWNELEAVNNVDYQVHFHVEYRHLDENGPTERFKPRPDLDDLRARLQTAQEKMDKNKVPHSKKKQFKRDIQKWTKERTALEAQPRESLGIYKPNGHILLADPPHTKKKLQACAVLADDATAVAVQFKNTALSYEKESDARLMPYLCNAFRDSHRDSRPPYVQGDRSVDKGKALVKWWENKGENRVQGLRLFFVPRTTAEPDDDDEKKDGHGEVVSASMTKGTDLIEQGMDLSLITQSVDEREAIKAYLSSAADRDFSLAAEQRAARNRTAPTRTYRRPCDDESDDEDDD